MREEDGAPEKKSAVDVEREAFVKSVGWPDVALLVWCTHTRRRSRWDAEDAAGRN